MKSQILVAAAALSVSLSSYALEYPIGEPGHNGGLEVAAVYLQPIRMEPEGMMTPADKSDIHLEADIHAAADNRNGFAEGVWVPYLKVSYELTNLSTGAKISGDMMPMVASDGPHYGDNVKLAGYGKYHLKFTVYAPIDNPMGKHFGRHTDKESGVDAWFKPFAQEWDFVYSGIGKKGGY